MVSAVNLVSTLDAEAFTAACAQSLQAVAQLGASPLTCVGHDAAICGIFLYRLSAHWAVRSATTPLLARTSIFSTAVGSSQTGFWLHADSSASSINMRATDLHDEFLQANFATASFTMTPPTTASAHHTRFNPMKTLGRNAPRQVSSWHIRWQQLAGTVIDPNALMAQLLQAY